MPQIPTDRLFAIGDVMAILCDDPRIPHPLALRCRRVAARWRELRDGLDAQHGGVTLEECEGQIAGTVTDEICVADSGS